MRNIIEGGGGIGGLFSVKAFISFRHKRYLPRYAHKKIDSAAI
jgi:hypothetical protein